MEAYAQAYLELLKKGYTPEHLMSLPRIVKLPEDVMMNEIIPHLNYEDVIQLCSSSQHYTNLCTTHHVFENIYNKRYQSIDFLPVPENYLERIKLLEQLITINKELDIKTSIKKLYLKKELYIENDNITSIPDDIGALKYLKDLTITYCNIRTLPSSLGYLNLTGLDLSHNKLIQLPDEICQLTNLIDLNLEGNALTTLPYCIDKMKRLTELSASSNKLTKLPINLFKLKRLKSLDLGYNEITNLPDNIGELQKLKYLRLGHNKLTSLPSSLSSLPLYALNINANEITSLPESFVQLTKLIILTIDKNIKVPKMPNSKLKIITK